MPKVNGVQATRAIMKKCPCAILVVTGSVQENARMVFEAMGAGALDAVDTPALGLDNFDKVSAPLLAKLDSMRGLLGEREPQRQEPRQVVPGSGGSKEAPLVVIGASAGGPSALAEVLRNLPQDFPSPVVIVQHVDEQFALSLAGWLKQQSILPVKPAVEGSVLTAGEVLIAARSDHLILAGPRRLGYCAEPKEGFYRPSVDVFFDSVARRWPGQVVGVLLTGMGRDGAQGLKRLREAGFHTIAQDRASCAVYGMPKAAVDIGAAVLCKRCSLRS